MAVMSPFKNLDRPLPFDEQLDGSAHDLAAESAEMRTPLAPWRADPILQRLEAGQ
jgi:hypothetical protein